MTNQRMKHYNEKQRKQEHREKNRKMKRRIWDSTEKTVYKGRRNYRYSRIVQGKFVKAKQCLFSNRGSKL